MSPHDVVVAIEGAAELVEVEVVVAVPRSAPVLRSEALGAEARRAVGGVGAAADEPDRVEREEYDANHHKDPEPGELETRRRNK